LLQADTRGSTSATSGTVAFSDSFTNFATCCRTLPLPTPTWPIPNYSNQKKKPPRFRHHHQHSLGQQAPTPPEKKRRRQQNQNQKPTTKQGCKYRPAHPEQPSCARFGETTGRGRNKQYEEEEEEEEEEKTTTLTKKRWSCCCARQQSQLRHGDRKLEKTEAAAASERR